MELTEARATLDRIDRQIQELFLERMELVGQIGCYKRERGMDIFDPVREAEVLRAAATHGGALDGYNRRLMETLLELSREYQGALLQAEKNAQMRRKN